MATPRASRRPVSAKLARPSARAGAAVSGVPDSVLSAATAHLRQYLRIDTTNPPGDVRQAVEFLSRLLRAAKIEHRVFASDRRAGKLNLLARLPARPPPRGSDAPKPLLLMNHMDVVPVERAKWSVDPFGGVIKDGCVWGRGALDMKSMGMAELTTLLVLKQRRAALARDVLFLAVCDEEIGGGLGAKWMVRHHYGALDPEFVLDEGGGGSVGLLAPGGRVVFAPSVNEKQIAWLKLTVRGIGGHGSMPEPVQAAEILHQALARLIAAKPSLERADDDPVVAEMRRRLPQIPANRYTNAISKNTVTITSVQAGVGSPPQPNVIPSEATATLDCRLLPEVSVPDFLARLRGVLGDERVQVDVLHQPSEHGRSSGHDTALFRAIEAVIAQRFPGAVVAPMLLTGGTDSRFFRDKGASAYGFEPLVMTPADMDLIHGHDERIRITDFHQMITVLHEIVRRVAAQPA